MWKPGSESLNSTALGEGIIEADAGPADGLPYPESPQFRRELGGCVIASAVAVEYRSFRQFQVPGGHLDRGGDQRGLVILAHRPADDFPGRAVDDRSQQCR